MERLMLGLLLAVLTAISSPVSVETAKASVSEEESPNENESSSNASNSEPWLRPLLPDNLQPVEYFLTEIPDFYFEGSVFNGSVSIRFKVHNETDTILVHIRELNVTDSTLVNENGTQLIISEAFEYKPNEYWVVKIANPLQAGTEASLKLDFAGSLESGVGFYKCTYVNDITGETSWLATTMLQLTEARRAFPCFDEPRFKTHFTITLRHWRNFTALSNMPFQSHVVIDDIWQDSTFERSPLMSTYFVALSVSDFTYKNNTLSDGKQNRVWARPDRIDQVDYPLHASKIINDFFVLELAEPYTLPKLDHFAVPDLAPFATEQWGLIVYRDGILLDDPPNVDSNRKQMNVAFIAHELAHNHFGNLVTCRNWSEVWLNEGFATFYEIKGVVAAEPTIHYDGQFFSRFVQLTMIDDALNTSRPLVIKTETPKTSMDDSDIVVYNKGAAVLIMMESFLGEDDFKLGIRRFIQDHKYKLVDTDDLWAAFKQNDSSDNLKSLMSSWIYLMGFPVVNVNSSVGDVNMTLSQQRFLLDPTSDTQSPPTPNGYQWSIPIKYRTKDGTIGFFWLNEMLTHRENPVKTNDSYLVLNNDHSGYYIVNYSLELWNRLKQQLNNDHLNFTEVERSKLLYDALILARAEQLNYSTALDMTEYSRKETGLLPWDTMVSSFEYIRSMIFLRSEKDVFRNYLRYLTSDIVNELGVDDKGDHAEKILRSKIIGLACSSGQEVCMSNTSHLFTAWIADNVTGAIPLGLRRDVYREGLSNSSLASDWLTVRSRYIAATSGQEKDNLLNALSGTKNIELMERLLEYAFDESFIRSKDFMWFIDYVASNLDVNDCVWQWFKRNYDLIVDKYGAWMIEFVLPRITSSFNTRQQQQEVRDWFEYRQGIADDCKSTVMQKIDANIRWIERSLPDVARWLNLRNDPAE